MHHDPDRSAAAARQRRAGVPLWIAAIVLAGLALLVLFEPPHYRLWQLSIPVQEWGYWLLPATILLSAVAFRRGGTGLAAGALIAVAGAVLLRPAAQAALLTRGEEGVRLSLPVLITGFDVPDVAPSRMTYAERASGPLVLDYYEPPGVAAPWPVVVVIHGGGWRSGAPTDLAPLNRWMAGRGYAVAAVSYRLAPDHPFPAALEDVRAAVEYLEADADELGIDPDRIVLLGRSAGGHLALLTAYTSADPAVRGVISFYGPTDLVWAWENPSPEPVYDSRGTLEGFTGGTPEDLRDVYAAASPVSHVAGAIPTLLVHGALDPLVSVRHSRTLADSLRRRGSDVTYLELPWATHGCDFAFNGPCGQISAAAVARFLESHL